MPPTTENIPERPGFDVYAMLLVLSFFFLLGATLLLNDDLDKNWGFWLPPENLPKKAEHITEINDEPAKFPGLIKVRDVDVAEWKLAYEGYYGKKVSDEDFPVKDYKWPSGYKPLEHPVMPGADNLQTVPKDQIEALMQGYKGPDDVTTTGGAAAPAPTPAPAPEAAPTPAPAPKDAPKEAPKDSPKEAPKAN